MCFAVSLWDVFELACASSFFPCILKGVVWDLFVAWSKIVSVKISIAYFLLSGFSISVIGETGTHFKGLLCLWMKVHQDLFQKFSISLALSSCLGLATFVRWVQAVSWFLLILPLKLKWPGNKVWCLDVTWGVQLFVLLYTYFFFSWWIQTPRALRHYQYLLNCIVES